jgi:hypothetical protein
MGKMGKMAGHEKALWLVPHISVTAVASRHTQKRCWLMLMFNYKFNQNLQKEILKR